MLATTWNVFGVGAAYEYPDDFQHYFVYWVGPWMAAIAASFLYVIYGMLVAGRDIFIIACPLDYFASAVFLMLFLYLYLDQQLAAPFSVCDSPWVRSRNPRRRRRRRRRTRKRRIRVYLDSHVGWFAGLLAAACDTMIDGRSSFRLDLLRRWFHHYCTYPWALSYLQVLFA
jgi:hypothetical protein